MSSIPPGLARGHRLDGYCKRDSWNNGYRGLSGKNWVDGRNASSKDDTMEEVDNVTVELMQLVSLLKVRDEYPTFIGFTS